MINVWVLTMVIVGHNYQPTSYQLKFDSLQKCVSYNGYISEQYKDIPSILKVKGICVQTQEQKTNAN